MASPRASQRNEPAEAWRIMRWRSLHWAHREPLAEGVAEQTHLDKEHYRYLSCIVFQRTGNDCDNTY